jgi:hypothetical protein
MPIGPTRTKAQKQNVVHTEMHKFKEGDLHSGSKHGPVVKNRKQAVAIAMSESGQSKHKKEKGYDRSGHFPGNPGFKREGKPPYGDYNAGAHAKQPHGKSIGNAPEFTGHRANQSYQAELSEHHGGIAGRSSMGRAQPEGGVAHTGPADRGGSELQEKGPAPGNHHQPAGKSLGAGRTDVAEHHEGKNFGGVAHSFRPPAANNASGYGHAIEQRKGPLRMSGHSGAHRVGHRSK